MPLNSRLIFNASATGSLDINTVASGSYANGPTVTMDKIALCSLSAVVMCEAETNTITMTAVWQVSNDQTTWYDVYSMNNAAYTVVGTGTSGDDAAVTKVIEAPRAVYGFRFARVSILVGVTTGTANDKYSIGYNYAREPLS